MAYKTREQELEELKRYVEYTLKNIDDFERRIRKEKERKKKNGNYFEMNKEDKQLIHDVSNREFPLDKFLLDFEILNRLGRMDGFEYEAILKDLVKIARTFKYYHDECERKEEN